MASKVRSTYELVEATCDACGTNMVVEENGTKTYHYGSMEGHFGYHHPYGPGESDGASACYNGRYELCALCWKIALGAVGLYDAFKAKKGRALPPSPAKEEEQEKD